MEQKLTLLDSNALKFPLTAQINNQFLFKETQLEYYLGAMVTKHRWP